MATTQNPMPTATFSGVSLTTQANVYFEGKCVSHSFTTADGAKKSVGVILPSTLVFNTAAAELMECVAGSCEYKLQGNDQWHSSSVGERFCVPANTCFEIRVEQIYHYVCHFV